jgi:hypothetical protein
MTVAKLANKYKDAELASQNWARKQWGLPLLQPKTRTCTGCNKAFRSTGNRRCPSCRHHEAVSTLSGVELL